MYYNIIKSGNFADIEKIQESARVDILKRYALDQWENYTHGDFAIMGEKTLNMFFNTYGGSVAEADEIKTDGKTRAAVVPYITVSYYYDARDGGRGGLSISKYIRQNFIVSFDGVLLDSYTIDNKRQKWGFTLLNDNTDYNKYLPSSWYETHKKPQYVGTLTDKKAAAWLQWLKERKEAAEAVKTGREDKVAAFLAKVRQIDTTQCKEARIDEKRGYFVRNGLRYSYEISDGGRINEKLEIDYIFNHSTLEAFNLMVTGNFK
jgi:hypothetical protein